jgi:hypothetical protein
LAFILEPAALPPFDRLGALPLLLLLSLERAAVGLSPALCNVYVLLVPTL